jgi:hypothetical protein
VRYKVLLERAREMGEVVARAYAVEVPGRWGYGHHARSAGSRCGVAGERGWGFHGAGAVAA